VHTTWRATTAHLLLGIGAGLTLILAIGLGPSEAVAWHGWVAWISAGLVSAGLAVSWLQHRTFERFRGRLAVGLTHHLRTSLAHIQTYNEMLLLGSDSSEDERRQWLEVIGREAERLGTTVENVLLIVNEAKGTPYPLRRSVDLGALLEDVACGYSSTNSTTLRLEEGPPAGIMVSADPAAIRHALGNLFQSLGRCCVPGSNLSAALTTDGSTATIRVDLEDSLIDPQRLEGMGRLHSSDLERETGDGFGLEIAVVQHVARAHGGRATSFHNDRTSGFLFELPLSGA